MTVTTATLVRTQPVYRVPVKYEAPVQYALPDSDQYPFDSIISRIVAALEARNWNVPGFFMKFKDTAMADRVIRHVTVIESIECRLHFWRTPPFYAGGAVPVGEITIPGRQLRVFDDESGPQFFVYVGRDWEQDQEEFFDTEKFHAKLYQRPRTYARYYGCFNKPEEPSASRKEWQRAPYLVATTDSREYALEPGEPSYYLTEAVFAEFTSYLEEHVLKQIQESP
jgi:hypothetical protein